MTAVLAIGAKAQAALAATRGLAQPLAAFPDAPYFDAGGEIVWIGARLPARHPRAVMTAAPVVRGSPAAFAAWPAQAWSRALPDARHVDGERARATARRLVKAIARVGAPRGFGALLAGRRPAFPLELAVPRVRALAAAYADGSAEAVHAATLTLLGLGAGLTPSGDDLGGAAIFARRLVDRSERWRDVGARLAAAARSATHAISAALFADLVAGASFEPLHDLAEALAAGDVDRAIAAASALAPIGHSSGWDMLTGVAVGLDALPDADGEKT